VSLFYVFVIMKNISKKNLRNKEKKQDKSCVSFFDLLRRFLVFWFLMFFCAIVITQQESFLEKISNIPQEIVFVLPGSPNDWWMDENEIWTHGSAWDWGFLFEDEVTDDQTFKPVEITDNQIDDSISIEENSVSYDKDYFPSDSGSFSDDKDIPYEWIDNLDISDIVIEDEFILDQDQSKVCITPWWEYLAHWDFVLAYEQRKDVDNLCNVQRRFCFDWKLNWTYLQKSCKEHTVYSYIKPEAISYTQKQIDDFVQPNQPSLSWANFDTHGKINWNLDPIDVWWNAGSWRPSEFVSTSQTPISNKYCITPWGERVKNWQFIKAYKAPIWLIDLPCDVELRLCVSGQLKWEYINRTCTFKKMTYRDYIYENYNLDNPSIGDLVNALDTDETKTKYKTRSFWKWLDKYF